MPPTELGKGFAVDSSYPDLVTCRVEGDQVGLQIEDVEKRMLMITVLAANNKSKLDLKVLHSGYCNLKVDNETVKPAEVAVKNVKKHLDIMSAAVKYYETKVRPEVDSEAGLTVNRIDYIVKLSKLIEQDPTTGVYLIAKKKGKKVVVHDEETAAKIVNTVMTKKGSESISRGVNVSKRYLYRIHFDVESANNCFSNISICGMFKSD